MQIKKKDQGGFTLIELLVVVVIIGILASVAVPNFMGAQDKAKNAGVQANGHTIQMAVEQYGVDNSGQYPATLAGVMPDYIAAYPATAWGKTQTAHFGASDKALNESIGSGKIDPADVNGFGAIGFSHGGAAHEQYRITGSGKKKQDAIVTFRVQNFAGDNLEAAP